MGRTACRAAPGEERQRPRLRGRTDPRSDQAKRGCVRRARRRSCGETLHVRHRRLHRRSEGLVAGDIDTVVLWLQGPGPPGHRQGQRQSSRRPGLQRYGHSGQGPAQDRRGRQGPSRGPPGCPFVRPPGRRHPGRGGQGRGDDLVAQQRLRGRPRRPAGPADLARRARRPRRVRRQVWRSRVSTTWNARPTQARRRA